MSDINDGGPAHPTTISFGHGCRGMTMRQYFAAHALPAVMVQYSQFIEEECLKGGNGSIHDIAVRIAYVYADAMLAEKALHASRPSHGGKET